MSVRAVVEGALIGLAVALVLAFAVAIMDYQVALSTEVQSIVIWIGAGATALGAGWGAGRTADMAGWLNGALAAITLNLVAAVVAETLHVGNVTHLWTGLGLALVIGMIGGMAGTAMQ